MAKGDIAQRMYIITSGELALYNAQGKWVHCISPGMFLGHESLFSKGIGHKVDPGYPGSTGYEGYSAGYWGYYTGYQAYHTGSPSCVSSLVYMTRLGSRG